MSRFKTVAPVMVYIEPKELSELKKYAKSTKKTVSQIVREGVSMRLAEADDPYSKGLREGLNKAMELAKNASGAQMKFPSGKTFGELVCDEIEMFSIQRFGGAE
jgi:hypothetical protein